MIDGKQCINIILEWFPNFLPMFKEHLNYWKHEKERPFGLDMAEFSSYAASLIKNGSDKEVEKLVDFTELMITEGNDEVNYAIKLEFLENITNRNDYEGFPIERFTTRLKPVSKEFCKELDKFWGTRTKGVN
jgi:hypothetical protein